MPTASSRRGARRRLTRTWPPRLSLSRLAKRDRPVRPRRALVASLAFVAGLGTGGLAVTGLVSLDRRPAPAMINGPEMAGMRLLAARALAAHRTFAVEVRHPVEVAAAEEPHLVQWLSKRLDYPIVVPNLQSEGFWLLGGRLLSGDEEPAALLMFENNAGERLTLYCTRAKADRETAFRYAEAGGNAAFYWSDKDAAYALAGPAGRDRLLRIARKTYEAMEGPSKAKP
jgi:anti-sigma factor RsiW